MNKPDRAGYIEIHVADVRPGDRIGHTGLTVTLARKKSGQSKSFELRFLGVSGPRYFAPNQTFSTRPGWCPRAGSAMCEDFTPTPEERAALEASP